MTKSFEERILRERIVDTRNYRYTVKECYDATRQWLEIRRLPLEKLDTTATLTDWEVVKIIS